MTAGLVDRINEKAQRWMLRVEVDGPEDGIVSVVASGILKGVSQEDKETKISIGDHYLTHTREFCFPGDFCSEMLKYLNCPIIYKSLILSGGSQIAEVELIDGFNQYVFNT